MDSLYLEILIGVVALAIGIILGRVIKGQSNAQTVALEKKLSSLEADANDGDKIKSAMVDFKGSQEFKAMQELEYRKGWEIGQKEILAQFQIQYEKFSNVDDKWFSSLVETGYCMQFFFSGLPIGDVTKRIIHAEKKVNKEAVKEILDRVDRTVNNLIEVAKQSKISVKEATGLVNK